MTNAEFLWGASKDQFILPGKRDRSKLSDQVLISNIRWFIIFRWAVIATLVLFELLTVFKSDFLAQFGITERQNWPIAIIIILSIANFSYLHTLNACQSGKSTSPTVNLWVQIFIDLLCLSVVVHFMGSITTPVAFFYVLHIVLACIFFSTRESLLVTILVCIMYSVVLYTESYSFVQEQEPVLVDFHIIAESMQETITLLWIFVLDILFFVVWYVVSRLSIVVRAHERHLLEAYQRINTAQVEKDQYALLMTHQLKSPLDAIRSKINLITAGYCGESSPETKSALADIDNRAQTMSGLILDLLRLERLKETCLNTAVFEPIDIETTIKKSVDKLAPIANSKHIDIKASVENFVFSGIADQVEMLIENIISNAITYSHDDTSVVISSETDKQNHTASITIRDHGIGIDSKDLPNIFNEYFYSPRAVMHNKSSSGIGLSIVKKAAENNKLQINVASEPGVGTAFTIIFQMIKDDVE